MDHAELAGQIAGRIQAHPSEFKSVTAADSGYINFTMSPQWLKNAMSEITDTGDHFGHKDQKTSGSAVIITLDDQYTETENTAFFRNESVALALESILKAS